MCKCAPEIRTPFCGRGAKHKPEPDSQAEYDNCGGCAGTWPCESVRLATKLKAAEQVVEAARRVYRVQANRRLADLDKKQLIRKSESRVSAVTGRLECTWSPRIPSDSGAEQGGLW